MRYDKLILAYLDGELTGKKLEKFLLEVEQNRALAKELNLYRALYKFLKKKADELKKREDLNRIHEEFMKSLREKENKPKLELLNNLN